MTPDPDLPARVLRAYRANCDMLLAGSGGGIPITNLSQRARAALFDRAIATLERGQKVSQGMTAARRGGRQLGRPVKLAGLVPQVQRLQRAGLNAAEITRRLGGKVSESWVRKTLRG